MDRWKGVLRERKSRNPDLKQEVQRVKKPIFMVAAPLGIVGEAGTGRKTLAYRFDNMDGGVFQDEVPLAYCYAPCFDVDFLAASRTAFPFSKIRMQLRVYIIEEPLELPPKRIPYYVDDWDEFCCLILLFDISRTPTFGGVMTALQNFRRKGWRLPDLLLVGNKYDEVMTQSPPRGNLHTEEEAQHQGIEHFLCSAKRNIGVAPLFRKIQKLVWWNNYARPPL